ncbi:hypothetical protein O181_039625 [Austropuccinia psidii MF-1]|uniref:Uncharacterized protein n=1 Tax=Austropuccinia psidii MF-1 TaxID=1389203 RepID=A0A9Q3DF85_9BASI|nr:hypothetical protein [Austropuccinia psidii MF-1]
MVTICQSSNVLSPLPSFIGQIITSLWFRSEVTIRWWPRRGVDKSILEGPGLIVQNHSCLPVLGPSIHSRWGMLSSSSTTKESWAGTLLAMWLEWPDNEQAFLACLLASITSAGCCQGANAGDTPLSA